MMVVVILPFWKKSIRQLELFQIEVEGGTSVEISSFT